MAKLVNAPDLGSGIFGFKSRSAYKLKKCCVIYFSIFGVNLTNHTKMRATKKIMHDRILFIKNNLHLGNIELSEKLNITVFNVEIILKRNKIKRPPEVVHEMRLKGGQKGSDVVHSRYKYNGENNPNWRGGISKNKYRYKKIQKERYPEKISARNKVYHAVKVGNLIKKPCEECGENPSFAHHEDYFKPLEVTWYCRKHHRAKHGNRH